MLPLDVEQFGTRKRVRRRARMRKRWPIVGRHTVEKVGSCVDCSLDSLKRLLVRSLLRRLGPRHAHAAKGNTANLDVACGATERDGWDWRHYDGIIVQVLVSVIERRKADECGSKQQIRGAQAGAFICSVPPVNTVAELPCGLRLSNFLQSKTARPSSSVGPNVEKIVRTLDVPVPNSLGRDVAMLLHSCVPRAPTLPSASMGQNPPESGAQSLAGARSLLWRALRGEERRVEVEAIFDTTLLGYDLCRKVG